MLKTSSTLKQSEVVIIHTEQKQTLSHDRLLKTLYFMLDLFSRGNIPFFLMGETANQVKHDKPLSGDKLELGIRYLDFQPRTLSILAAFYFADEVNEHEIKYTYEGVPVSVKVVYSDDPMFTSLDTKMYMHDNFSLPNPFERYWETRHLYL